MTFSSSVSPRILGSRGTTDADQPPHPAVRLRKGLINSGTAYRKTKATLYSLQDAEEFYVLSNYINKSKASKRYWLAFLSAPYTKEDEKVYNSGWSVEIAIPKKAQPEAGEHGEGTLPAPWEESRPAFDTIPKPKRFNFLHSHGMKLSLSSIGWETTPRPVDHLLTGIRNSSPPKRRRLTKRRVRHEGRSVRSAVIKVRDHLRPKRMVKGIRGVLVDDLFWFQEELGIETSDSMQFLYDREWLQYREAASISLPSQA
ncbi:uncharacterized protein LW93_12286 [Fusarium fujikuroi]|nr:uncharacterized protein LW93_12286 [Fusarium fujikuroi]